MARLLALVETERRYYQEIVASFPIGAAIVSRSGAIVFANRAFRRLAGIRPGELQSKNLEQVIASQALMAAVEDVLRSSSTRARVPVEMAGYNFQASVIPLHGWEDDPETEALIAFEGAGPPQASVPSDDTGGWPALLWTMHPETQQFLSIEGAEEHLLGYSPQHWTSTPDFWRERVHADDRPAFVEFFRSAIRKGGEFGCEYRALTASRKPVWRRDTFRVTLDGEGNPIRITGVTIDITARRRAETDNVKANRLDALTGLSRRLSHDFNNSLMVVTGYAEELLAHMPDTDPRRSDINAILASAESMAGVSGELGGFARRQATRPGSTDLSAILTEAAGRIRTELGSTLVLRLPQQRLTAHADAAQFEAVLISVARRLRDKNDPHMILVAGEVTVDELPNLPFALRPGRYVEVVMRGPFLAEIPPASFETLVSGKNPHATDMTRAYLVVREWGGTLYALRTEHTSEVHILLPASMAEPVAPAAPKPKPAAEPAPAVPVAPTVLVVEDEKGIRGLVQKILKREGYEVLVASSGDQADEVAARSTAPIRLLVTDVTLAGQSGREIADRIAGHYPDLRVLYISGYNDDPEVTLRELGGTPFLQKPFTLAALVKKVREIVPPGMAKAAGAE